MAWSVRLAADEACDPVTPFLSPDLLLTENLGPQLAFDYGPAEPDETHNRQGLTAKRGLHTAVILQLFSDRRLPEEVAPLDELDPDPRGWWGDSVDRQPGEDEIGSLLWTLRRAPLTDDTARRAEDYAQQALAVIIRQGAVVRFDVVCEPQHQATGTGLLAIKVDGYGEDGTRRYATRFQVLWDQIETLSRQGRN